MGGHNMRERWTLWRAVGGPLAWVALMGWGQAVSQAGPVAASAVAAGKPAFGASAVAAAGAGGPALSASASASAVVSGGVADGATGPAWSGQPPGPFSPRQVLPADEWRLSLERLLGSDEPLRMESTQGALRLPLPLPWLWQPRELELQLVGQVSQALISGSQWVLEVNGHPVHQLALQGSQAEVKLQARIPLQWVKPGFNEVRLRYVQHYTEHCEYPMAPQLWSVIDPARSGWVMRAGWQPTPLRLDRLDALFDKTGWDERPLVPVWLADLKSPQQLQAAGLVAQGVGWRYDYVPVRMRATELPADIGQAAAELPREARGAVVIGTRAALDARGLLAGLAIPPDAGPLVALRPMPGDAQRYLLLFVAPQEADLAVTASAFALGRMPWPQQPWVAISALKMPPLGSVTGAAAKLRPSTHAYPLSAMGFRTTTFEGMYTQGATLRVWNPTWQGRMQLRLHASYAAGMGSQSAFNVLANGVLHGSVPLDDPQGGRYDAYGITLPAGALQPGWNTLQLRPVLMPLSNGGDCKPFLTGNLAVTVYEDSTVQLMGGVPQEQPDLGLLSRDGRPLPTAPVGLGMAVQLTDADPTTVGAGLTLMAKLAQVFNGPLLRTEFRVGASASASNRVWVGPLGRLGATQREVLGLDAQGRWQVPVPIITSATVPVLEGGDTLAALREQIDPLVARPTLHRADLTFSPTLSGLAMAATALAEGQPTTVFTAGDGPTLERSLHALTGHALWSQLRGQHAVWTPEAEQLQALDAQDAPFTAYSLRGGLGLWISQYPWSSLLIVVMGLLLLGWLSRRLLALYQRWRHPVKDTPL